jgi:hypothetical protein
MVNSFKAWHEYFAENRLNTGDIAWNQEDVLTGEEKDCIGKSIAAFQLGEYSEGRGLLKAAQEYAARTGNEYLIGITRMFIGEEQRHAMLLKRFMTIHRIKLLNRNWTDTVFRRLRKGVGYELSITVLITAEIISLVYYRALRGSTGSSLLRGICDKILSDEAAHVKYESQMITGIRDSKPTLLKQAAVFLHQFLFSGTILVVYLSHKRVLDSGYNFARFWATCWVEFSACFPQTTVVRATAGA